MKRTWVWAFSLVRDSIYPISRHDGYLGPDSIEVIRGLIETKTVENIAVITISGDEVETIQAFPPLIPRDDVALRTAMLARIVEVSRLASHKRQGVTA